MTDRRKTKGVFFSILILVSVFFLSARFGIFRTRAGQVDFDSSNKRVTVDDGGIIFDFLTDADTIGDFLAEQRITINDRDSVIPERSNNLYSGINIIIRRAKKVSITEGGGTRQVYTLQDTAEEAVWEQKDIDLGDDDFTTPSRQSLVTDGMKIAVTHVLIKQETEEEKVPFKTITNNDDSLGWRVTKVTQKGVPGILQETYKVVYYDGKQISKKLLDSQRTQDPTDEIVTQGTLVKTGKSYTGAASWYSYTGTLAAANPWLPMGSYVRVTNTENGKSVIVKINDRGPFGNGRIIDLDKVAFAKIANLGAGVANVKVEVVTN